MKNKKLLAKEEIDKLMETKYRKCLPHTKEYIRKKLKEGTDKKDIPNTIISREDFIEQYYKSQECKDCIPVFNFSGVPEIRFIEEKGENL